MTQRTTGGRIAYSAAVWACRVAILGGVIALMTVAPGRWVSVFAVAKPADIARDLAARVSQGGFYEDLWVTVVHAAVPLVFSAVVGVLTAWLLWLAPRSREVVEGYLAVAYATPRVIFLPLFILWLGTGSLTVIVYVTIACYFIFVFNALEGFIVSGSRLVGVLEVLGLKRRHIFFTYLLPAARGYLLAATLIAFPTAVLGAIIGEMIVGGGLGGWIMEEKALFNTSGLYAATLTATVFAGLLNIGVQRLGVVSRRRMGLDT